MEEQLSNAIISGDLEFLKAYINEGNDFNQITLVAPDGYGKIPVELAVLSQLHYKGSIEITRLILENSNAESQAEILLNFASEDSYLEKMKALLESGIPVDLPYNNQTALQRATGNRNLKMVHLLLEHGADPNKSGEYGTAFEEAQKIYYEPAYQEMMTAFMSGKTSSPFDFVNKDGVISQLKNWIFSLLNLAKNNKNQTFYVIAIDGMRLIANSEEEFKITLKKYQRKFPRKYRLEEEIKSLKFNTGDFSFHEIQIQTDDLNTDIDLDLTFLEKRKNENRTKNDLLFEGLLKNKELFTSEMNTTDDFKIVIKGHVY